MKPTLQELKEEISQDSFRSERGRINGATLSQDLLAVFGEEHTCLNKYSAEDGVGTGIFSVLAYQNLLLLERIEILEASLTKEKQDET